MNHGAELPLSTTILAPASDHFHGGQFAGKWPDVSSPPCDSVSQVAMFVLAPQMGKRLIEPKSWVG